MKEAAPDPWMLSRPHVRHIEDTDIAADSLGLGDDTLVLHRHLPPRKGHHTGAGSGMVVVEGGTQHGGGVRRQGVLQSLTISIVCSGE